MCCINFLTTFIPLSKSLLIFPYQNNNFPLICSFQFFMIVPLAVLYILANITFQMAVKNSAPQSLNCETCWNHTNHLSNHVKYYNAFQLMYWYFNPVLWTFVLCLCQAISHSFERKWHNYLGSQRIGHHQCSQHVEQQKHFNPSPPSLVSFYITYCCPSHATAPVRACSLAVICCVVGLIWQTSLYHSNYS